MTFQEKLVKLRKLKGINQSELAAAVGVSRQAVYKWESGQSYPEVSKLIELKALFNISIDDLLDDNYEVILPEKTKKRSRKVQEEKAEPIEEVKTEIKTEEKATVTEETAADAKEETVHQETVVPTSEIPNEELTDEKTENKEEPKKRGFFSRLFGG